MGLHADRWRAADAGAAAFPHAGLFADPACLSLRALRGRGDRDQSVCGLDRGALRPDLDALCRAWPAGAGADRAGTARPGLGRGAVGRLCDGGAGGQRRRQGPGQDVVEIGGQDPGPGRGRWPFPLGRRADRIEERGEGPGFPAGCRASGNGGVCGGGSWDGRGSGCDPCRGPDLHAAGSAQRAQGCEVLGGLFEIPQRELAVGGAGLPVRRTGRVVRGGHPDLFLRRAVGWIRGRQPRGVLHDRQLHGGLDHPLRRGPGLGAPALACGAAAPGRACRRRPRLGLGAVSGSRSAGCRGGGVRRTRPLADGGAGGRTSGVRRVFSR